MADPSGHNSTQHSTAVLERDASASSDDCHHLPNTVVQVDVVTIALFNDLKAWLHVDTLQFEHVNHGHATSRALSSAPRRKMKMDECGS